MCHGITGSFEKNTGLLSRHLRRFYDGDICFLPALFRRSGFWIGLFWSDASVFIGRGFAASCFLFQKGTEPEGNECESGNPFSSAGMCPDGIWRVSEALRNGFSGRFLFLYYTGSLCDRCCQCFLR